MKQGPVRKHPRMTTMFSTVGQEHDSSGSVLQQHAHRCIAVVHTVAHLPLSSAWSHLSRPVGCWLLSVNPPKLHGSTLAMLALMRIRSLRLAYRSYCVP